MVFLLINSASMSEKKFDLKEIPRIFALIPYFSKDSLHVLVMYRDTSPYLQNIDQSRWKSVGVNPVLHLDTQSTVGVSKAVAAFVSSTLPILAEIAKEVNEVGQLNYFSQEEVHKSDDYMKIFEKMKLFREECNRPPPNIYFFMHDIDEKDPDYKQWEFANQIVWTAMTCVEAIQGSDKRPITFDHLKLVCRLGKIRSGDYKSIVKECKKPKLEDRKLWEILDPIIIDLEENDTNEQLVKSLIGEETTPAEYKDPLAVTIPVAKA